MEQENKNYYEVLEIPISSSQDEIYQGYLRSKNAYTGDKLALYSLMTEEECRNILNLIDEAYSILSDPYKRRQYDKARGFNQGNEEAVKEYIAPYSPRATNIYVPESQSSNTNRENSFYESEGRVIDAAKEVRDLFDGPPMKGGNPFEHNDFTIGKNEHEVSRITAQKKFNLDYKKDQEMEQAIENAQVFTGELLKKIREYKNVTIERMSEMTKISKTYLKHIEADDFEKLPALAYVRGFVFQYAKCLKLTAELVATSYVHNLKSLKSEKSA